ncbi:MAG: hypothetical protein EA381_13575 [Planctomycetaceae bacterium]|nr:MAG: hypothetical protein EA381_13575 [Planctomycetaceae bacterium]
MKATSCLRETVLQNPNHGRLATFQFPACPAQRFSVRRDDVNTLDEHGQILIQGRGDNDRIDSARKVATDSIRFIRRRRGALLTAAVTGRISVVTTTG